MILSLRTKKTMVFLWLLLNLAGIAYVFWNTEYKYSLPTPVPQNYHAVQTGTFVDLHDKLTVPGNKPVFLHFFNPSCPCSRFNIPHFISLAEHYGSKVSFAIVVMDKDGSVSKEDIRKKFDLTIPVLFDTSIAVACGVYSTPQAVILDKAGKLFYRGNYNRSRYCTDTKSDFARMALDSLIGNTAVPLFTEAATTAYGCQLPSCKK